MPDTCEACELRSVEVVEIHDNSNEPYRVCAECHHRLISRALRPLEWYNLAKRHWWQQFLLHDDFYDEDGVALQPEEPVEAPNAFPAPSLAVVRRDGQLLLDYSITRWFLNEQVIEAWSSIGTEKTSAVLSERFAAQKNVAIRSRILEICAVAARESGASLVRYAWGEENTRELMPALAQATALCLPFREGFDRVASALKLMPHEQRHLQIGWLAHFRSAEVLDWIERHIREPITEGWGQLAAASALDWPRVCAWLRSGRPLSLAALDALVAVLRAQGLQAVKLRLLLPPDLETFKRELSAYAEKDPVPRVQQRVNKLIEGGEKLIKQLPAKPLLS